MKEVKERVPRYELSPLELADVLVNGGYCYRVVQVPCDHIAG